MAELKRQLAALEYDQPGSWTIVKKGRHSNLLKNCSPSFKSTVFSPPDAQVEEQRIIQVEPEDQKTSGRATRKTQAIGKVSFASIAPCKGRVPEGAKPFEAQTLMTDMRSAEEAKFEHDDTDPESPAKTSCATDKQELSRSREIPRENDTSTGGHCMRESLLAVSAVVSPRNQTGSTELNVKHLIRASPFAAVETSATDPQSQQESHQNFP